MQGCDETEWSKMNICVRRLRECYVKSNLSIAEEARTDWNRNKWFARWRQIISETAMLSSNCISPEAFQPWHSTRSWYPVVDDWLIWFWDWLGNAKNTTFRFASLKWKIHCHVVMGILLIILTQVSSVQLHSARHVRMPGYRVIPHVASFDRGRKSIPYNGVPISITAKDLKQRITFSVSALSNYGLTLELIDPTVSPFKCNTVHTVL